HCDRTCIHAPICRGHWRPQPNPRLRRRRAPGWPGQRRYRPRHVDLCDCAALAGFDGVAVAEWSANMLSPVLPGAQVDFIVERTGIDSRPRAGEVRTVTASVDGDVVLQATATMAAPRTFYGFPGQGIQTPGMGMDSYASSAAARDVWERADAHTRSKLGFSILEIVRNNPDRVVVDGEEFTHPDGALFLTQFTQVAMATLGCAQIAELAE